MYSGSSGFLSSWNISIASQLQTVYPGQGKGEFGLAVPAGDRDVLPVAADDGFYNIETQAPALPVEAPAFVNLVKPVKHQGSSSGGMVSPVLETET